MGRDIAMLKPLLSKGLYLDNIDEMIEICENAVRAMKDPLPVYVLSSVLIGIYRSWEDRPVTPEEVEQMEASLMPTLKEIAVLIETSADKDKLWAVLSTLVKAYILTY